MRIRTTTDPHRIEWKEKVGDRWVGRTVSITRSNLRRFGVPYPAEGKPITEWHETRLLAAVQSARQEVADAGRQAPPDGLLLSDAVGQYLGHDQVSLRRAQKREQVLLRAVHTGPSVHAKASRTKLTNCSSRWFRRFLSSCRTECNGVASYRL